MCCVARLLHVLMLFPLYGSLQNTLKDLSTLVFASLERMELLVLQRLHY
jgi:hypothetical protein